MTKPPALFRIGLPFVGMLCFLAAPAPASAQLGVESLLTNVHDIYLFSSCWNTRSNFLRESESCPSEKNGFGVEVLWSIHSIPLGKRPATARDSTSWKLATREVEYGPGAPDSTRQYTVVVTPVGDPRPTIDLELALGYSQFTGFSSSDPAFTILGSVREIPSLALYGTLDRGRAPLGWLQPFLGLRSGLIKLHDVQLRDPVTADSVATYAASGETFQVGAAVGLSASVARFSVIGEWAYNLRRFPSVTWSGESKRIPRNFPSGFDFSGTTVSLGVQVHLRDGGD